MMASEKTQGTMSLSENKCSALQAVSECDSTSGPDGCRKVRSHPESSAHDQVHALGIHKYWNINRKAKAKPTRLEPIALTPVSEALVNQHNGLPSSPVEASLSPPGRPDKNARDTCPKAKPEKCDRILFKV